MEEERKKKSSYKHWFTKSVETPKTFSDLSPPTSSGKSRVQNEISAPRFVLYYRMEALVWLPFKSILHLSARAMQRHSERLQP